jgi:acid phosphatase (class A)
MKTRSKDMVFSLALILSWCPICCADPATEAPQAARSASDGPPEKPYYLTGTEDVWRNFPHKPDPGSAVDQTDLLIILSVQASRTEDQKNEAMRDKSYSIKLITDVVDADFQTRYPNTFKVLSNADIDSYFINTMIKNANARLRPFVQHPTLVLPLFTVGGFSYPSGHASGLELQARILGQLFPAQRDALLKRARQIADGRILAGVHYPSDTEAGILLGDLLYTELESKSEFRKDLATAVTKDQIPAN